MSKTNIFFLLLLAVFCACKTSTNPLDGQQLRLITSDPDTVSVFTGQVTFTVTALQPSGYGASGAYIDFYDPIEQRARHEGPMPDDGELQFTDTVSASSTGSFLEFAFVAEYPGAITSDSLKLWVHEYDIQDLRIDSVEVNSWDYEDIGIQWLRPALDTGTDTVFISPQGQGGPFPSYIAPYPQSTVVVSANEGIADTITIHNAIASSRPVVWAPAYYYGYQESGHNPIQLYEAADSVNNGNTGIVLSEGYSAPINYFYNYNFAVESVDMIMVSVPSNHTSGVTIISPSISSMSGFSGGRTTAFYDIMQYIDSGTDLHELYFSQNLSTYVIGAIPTYEIPLPDSSQYSTAFIAVTQDGNYALVAVGPVTHDNNNYRYVYVAETYQPTVGLPYAGRGRKR
jgi:hypothetical protein